jgi:hypothetical protein
MKTLVLGVLLALAPISVCQAQFVYTVPPSVDNSLYADLVGGRIGLSVTAVRNAYVLPTSAHGKAKGLAIHFSPTHRLHRLWFESGRDALNWVNAHPFTKEQKEQTPRWMEVQGKQLVVFEGPALSDPNFKREALLRIWASWPPRNRVRPTPSAGRRSRSRRSGGAMKTMSRVATTTAPTNGPASTGAPSGSTRGGGSEPESAMVASAEDPLVIGTRPLDSKSDKDKGSKSSKSKDGLSERAELPKKSSRDLANVPSAADVEDAFSLTIGETEIGAQRVYMVAHKGVWQVRVGEPKIDAPAYEPTIHGKISWYGVNETTDDATK